MLNVLARHFSGTSLYGRMSDGSKTPGDAEGLLHQQCLLHNPDHYMSHSQAKRDIPDISQPKMSSLSTYELKSISRIHALGNIGRMVI